MTDRPAAVDAAIADLTDEQAAAVLHLVLERDHRLPDAHRLLELDSQVGEAVRQPVAIDATLPDAAPATSGDLARETLSYLAAQRPDLTETMERAIAMAQEPQTANARVDPVSVGIGALVVLALQTDLQIERGTNGKWRFKLHKKAMSDNALAKLIAKVIASYTGG